MLESSITTRRGAGLPSVSLLLGEQTRGGLNESERVNAKHEATRVDPQEPHCELRCETAEVLKLLAGFLLLCGCLKLVERMLDHVHEDDMQAV